MIANLAFYLFSLILLASAVMVVTSRNPVHAVLFLILGFVNAAVLFLLTGAEFLAFILAIVYVGAVAVIFLFVVMMLDVDFVALNEGFQRYAPVGALVALIMFIELAFIAGNWAIAPAGGADRMFPTRIMSPARWRWAICSIPPTCRCSSFPASCCWWR
ncbi:NADH-quinone oxidoreductase subunit J [Acidocella sp. MX-AZ03]|uniref:NADH-quinone oxidoreductase subunit J n=1 Tax=Acidocella sp. MX-AZ03 TaxID=2697363 RepID=UPI002FD80D52